MDRFCCGLLLVIHTELICLSFFFLSVVLCVTQHLPFLSEPGMVWFCIISVLLLLSCCFFCCDTEIPWQISAVLEREVFRVGLGIPLILTF